MFEWEWSPDDHPSLSWRSVSSWRSLELIETRTQQAKSPSGHWPEGLFLWARFRKRLPPRLLQLGSLLLGWRLPGLAQIEPYAVGGVEVAEVRHPACFAVRCLPFDFGVVVAQLWTLPEDGSHRRQNGGIPKQVGRACYKDMTKSVDQIDKMRRWPFGRRK